MKLSVNWIQDFVNITIPIEELAEKLSKGSTEIKQILKQEDKYKGLLVGEILEIEKHPDAKRLSVTKVNIGSKKLNIICGAHNIKVGQKVPVALVGSIIPNTWKTKNEFELKKTEIRGIESEGMMCSEKELDLGDNHEGIYILPGNSKVGQTLSSALELDDIVMDAEFLTNQGYCMSHLGLAGEISALTNEPVRQQHSEISLPTEDKDAELEVIIEEKKLCPRYSGIVLEGIKVIPSPTWMQRRLMAAGMRPINNIVDVTNYVLLEMGQPMHAFDYDKIARRNEVPTIIIRNSKDGETIGTLDEKQRELPKDILLITDEKKPIAIAGIIGGANTEIDDKTTKIVLESANFDAMALRHGARKLGIHTDAVSRFEKVLDPNLTMIALKRAVELLLEITKEGRVVSKVVDVYPKELMPWHINLSPAKVNRVLGIEIEKETQIKILERLGFKIDDQGENLVITVPTKRRDVKRDVDLIEEIIRIYGYDNIPLDYPLVPQVAPKLNPKLELIAEIRNLMIGLGFNEVLTYSFTGEEMLKACNIELGNHIKLLNPQSPERSYMRMSLIPEIMEATVNNLKTRDKTRLFEAQKIYWKNPNFSQEDKECTYAFEPEQLTMIVSAENHNYYDAKGVTEALLKHFKIKDAEYSNNKGRLVASKTFHPTKSAEIIVGNKVLGVVGEIHPQVLKNLGINQSTIGFELSIPTILSLLPQDIAFKTFSKYQTTSHDISVIVDDSVKAEAMHKAIYDTDEKLVKEVKAIDQYKGEGIPEGKKSIALNVMLQSDDHTLSPEEIEEVRDKIIKTLEKRFGAKIRE